MSFPRALAPLCVLLLLSACSDPDPTPDPVDSGVTTDAGTDAGADSGTDAGADSGTDAGADSGTDAGTDSGTETPLTINTESLPDGYVGRAYSAPLVASGGVPPYKWSLLSGALPEGMSLSEEGVLSGTPPAASAVSFTVEVRDAAGVAVRASLSATTYAVPALAEVPAAARKVGDTVTQPLDVTGGKAPFTFTSGTLPPGLTLASGVLQGTLSQAGTFIFDITATDANGVAATRTLTFTVADRFAITTGALPQGTRGEPYTFTLTASSGRAPLTWSLTGTPPAGLTLSTEGVLSGTPSSAGTSTFTVTVQDADGQTDTRELSLVVWEPGAPVFTVGQFNIAHFGDSERGPERSSSDGGTSDDLQIAYARDIMRDAGANVWGMVEMVDPGDFDVLKSQLPGFSGFLANNAAFVSGGTSPYNTGNQKVGVLYDSALTFQSARLILNDATHLPDFSQRPPLRVDFTTEIQGVETPLTVIVVHMRAESTTSPTEPRNARQRASAALKEYLDTNLPTQHVIVLGDWNDDVDVSITLDPSSGTPLPTPYQDFVSDAERYTFITRALSIAGDDTSIGFENVVDHTLASNEVAARYVSGSARVIYADTQVPDYAGTVSDHRPVTSAYAFSAETGPFLRLKAPQGGTYQAGSVLAMTWTSWSVGQVRVEASTDNGAQWSVLAASVPAAQGSYLWTLPDVDSSSVRVRVVDVSNPARMDTSDAALTLVKGPGRVFINEVLAFEPSGNQAFEFVELVNGSPFPVDISGWGVWDSSNNVVRHVFPSNSRLGAGKGFVVFGGSAGIPAGLTNAAAASSSALGLSNSGDSVRLRLPDGGTVDQYIYTSATQGVSVNRSPDTDPDGGFVLHTALPSGLSTSPGLRADGGTF